MIDFFSKNVKLLRTIAGWSLSEIADNTAFSRSQWNNYELGTSFPKFLDLIEISKKFDVTETDLIHQDLSMNVHLIEKLKRKFNNEDVHLNVHPSVHLSSEPLKRILPNTNLDGQPSPPPFNTYDFPTDQSIFDLITSLVGGGSAMEPTLYQPQLGEGLHVSVMLTGDTMQPTIQSGDKLLATHITDLSAIRPGHIYLLADNTDGIVCRRISQVSKTDLTLTSDNELYPPYKRPLKAITSVFKVREVHTTNLSPSNSELHKEIRSIRKELSQLQALLKKKSK